MYVYQDPQGSAFLSLSSLLFYSPLLLSLLLTFMMPTFIWFASSISGPSHTKNSHTNSTPFSISDTRLWQALCFFEQQLYLLASPAFQSWPLSSSPLTLLHSLALTSHLKSFSRLKGHLQRWSKAAFYVCYHLRSPQRQPDHLDLPPLLSSPLTSPLLLSSQSPATWFFLNLQILTVLEFTLQPGYTVPGAIQPIRLAPATHFGLYGTVLGTFWPDHHIHGLSGNFPSGACGDLVGRIHLDWWHRSWSPMLNIRATRPWPFAWFLSLIFKFFFFIIRVINII